MCHPPPFMKNVQTWKRVRPWKNQHGGVCKGQARTDTVDFEKTKIFQGLLIDMRYVFDHDVICLIQIIGYDLKHCRFYSYDDIDG